MDEVVEIAAGKDGGEWKHYEDVVGQFEFGKREGKEEEHKPGQ